MGFCALFACSKSPIASYFVQLTIQAAVSDVKCYGAFLESMEKVTDTISRYVIIESLYLQPGLDCTAKLEDAIISLYTTILKYLCKAKLYFGHRTMSKRLLPRPSPRPLLTIHILVRVGISVLTVELDASTLIADIANEEESVANWMAINGTQRSFRMSLEINDLTGTLVDFRKGMLC
jgi:hypothetical protein